jgi:hypothetical protein
LERRPGNGLFGTSGHWQSPAPATGSERRIDIRPCEFFHRRLCCFVRDVAYNQSPTLIGDAGCFTGSHGGVFAARGYTLAERSRESKVPGALSAARRMPVAYPTLSVGQRPGCPRLFESARQEGMGVKPHHHDSALAAASSVSVDRDGRSCKHRAAVTVPAKERKGQRHWSPRWCKVGKLQPTRSKQCTLHGARCAPCTALHVALHCAARRTADRMRLHLCKARHAP